MNNQLLDDSSCWPPLLARRVEEVCNCFEAARKAGQRPRIEVYLAGANEPERSILLRELLALELEYSTKLGEQPTPRDFEPLFPQHHELIRQAFRDLLRSVPPSDPMPIDRRARPQPDKSLSSTYPTMPPSALEGGTPVWPGSESDPVLPIVPGYEILDVLGRGGMGIVYRARDLRLDRLVALKVMLASAEVTERWRFRSEAQAVARLQHPHIVQIYEVGERDGLPYICLEYVDGGSLRDKLASSPFPPDLAARLTELVAGAVHFAHQGGIVHRDLKPANILLTGGGVVSGEPCSDHSPLTTHLSPLTPKIADFGLAKRLDQDLARTLTRSGALVGTPSYMAPEQAAGRNQEIGPATDIHALGAVLYEMLTGRPPFQAATVLETLEQVCSQEPVPPIRLQPKLSRDLETICLKCLQKEPQKRYASAEALADDLQRFLAGEPIRARPTPLWERGLKWAKRRRAVAALIVVSIITLFSLAVGGLSYGLLKDQERIGEQERSERKDKARAFLSKARDAMRQGDLEDAKVHLSSARATMDPDPALDNLRDEAGRLQAEVDREAERVREAREAEAAQQAALAKRAKFFGLADEAFFHGTPFSDVYPHASRQEAQKAARNALVMFSVPVKRQEGPVFEPCFTPDQRQEIKVACYELLLVLADAMAQEDSVRQLREAMQILEQAARFREPTRAYYLRQARYLALLGNAVGAARAGEKAAAAQPVSAHDFFLLGQELQRQANLAEAIRAFNDALRLQPDHFWARYYLAICHVQRRRIPDLQIAKACLDSCLLKKKEFAWAYVVRGSVRGKLGEFAAAEEDFDFAMKYSQNDEDIRYSVLVNRGIIRREQAVLHEAMAGWLLIRGDFAPAVADFQEAIRLKPDRYQAYMSLAKARQDQQNLAAAVHQLDQAIKISRPLVESRELEPSALTRLYQYRAELHRQRNDLKAALADLDLAIQAEPRDSKSSILAEVHVARGRILHVTRDFEKAVASYDAALRIRNNYPDAHLGRAESQYELSRFEGATRSFDRYFQHGGKPRADIYRKRAQAQAKLHKYSEAVADYTLALRLEPKADTYANRGWIHVVTGANKSALDDFEEAIRSDPQNGDAHNGRGLMRAKLGLANADADAQEALRLGPNTARHVWSAARIYAELVGRIDADPDRSRSRALAVRFDYQHQALQLLRQAVGLTDVAERDSFWLGKIEDDKAFRPIRSSPGYAQLRAEFAPKR
jgi:serine/threonine protein kinase/Tfp pilus assembly protein PilF